MTLCHQSSPFPLINYQYELVDQYFSQWIITHDCYYFYTKITPDMASEPLRLACTSFGQIPVAPLSTSLYLEMSQAICLASQLELAACPCSAGSFGRRLTRGDTEAWGLGEFMSTRMQIALGLLWNWEI